MSWHTQEGVMRLTYFGQSAFQLDGSDGTRIFVDPWIKGNLRM